MKTPANPQPITEVEARKRLAQAYQLLLSIAARRRAEAQNADNRTPADATTDHRDR